jgi:hypothetical protein
MLRSTVRAAVKAETAYSTEVSKSMYDILLEAQRQDKETKKLLQNLADQEENEDNP